MEGSLFGGGQESEWLVKAKNKTNETYIMYSSPVGLGTDV